MPLIELTRSGNSEVTERKVLVNTDHIITASKDSGGGSFLRLTHDNGFLVHEELHEIKQQEWFARGLE